MCTIRLKRESRLGYGARKIRVYMDGTLSCSIRNGDRCLLSVAPGRHELSFFLGKKLLTDVMFYISENIENFDVIFWITSAGEIEAKLTNNNVEHSIIQRKAHSSGSYIFLGIVIAVLALILFGFRIAPVIYLFPIN